MLLVSAVVAFSKSTVEQGPVAHAIFTLHQSVRLTQCGLVLFLLVFSRYLGISWRQKSFGLGPGFGLLRISRNERDGPEYGRIYRPARYEYHQSDRRHRSIHRLVRLHEREEPRARKHDTFDAVAHGGNKVSPICNARSALILSSQCSKEWSSELFRAATKTDRLSRKSKNSQLHHPQCFFAPTHTRSITRPKYSLKIAANAL